MTTIPTSNPERFGGSTCLLVEATPSGDIWFHMQGGSIGVITVSPSDLVEALIGLIPGLSVTYVPPVMVPQGIGAVVRGSLGGIYVRGKDGRWNDRISEESVAATLAAGGTVLSEGVTL